MPWGEVSDDRGVVYVEFLVSFFPLFFTFLCMVQLAGTAATRFAVQHAAVVGARAAMVVFVEDPKHYSGEPRRRVRLKRANAERGGAPRASDEPPSGESRAETVFRAVRFVLAPFAPSWSMSPTGAMKLQLIEQSVASHVGSSLGRLAFGWSAYPAIGLAMSFPEAPGSAVLQEERIVGERVTVRVTYLSACLVPVAARLLCHGKRQLLPKEEGDASQAAHVLRRVGSPKHLKSALQAGARFAVLHAEATMPLQTAGYEEDGG